MSQNSPSLDSLSTFLEQLETARERGDETANVVWAARMAKALYRMIEMVSRPTLTPEWLLRMGEAIPDDATYGKAADAVRPLYEMAKIDMAIRNFDFWGVRKTPDRDVLLSVLAEVGVLHIPEDQAFAMTVVVNHPLTAEDIERLCELNYAYPDEIRIGQKEVTFEWD